MSTPALELDWAAKRLIANGKAARQCVFEYIATLYNPVRIHQTLNYKSPDQFAADHAPAVAV